MQHQNVSLKNNKFHFIWKSKFSKDPVLDRDIWLIILKELCIVKIIVIVIIIDKRQSDKSARPTRLSLVSRVISCFRLASMRASSGRRRLWASSFCCCSLSNFNLFTSSRSFPYFSLWTRSCSCIWHSRSLEGGRDSIQFNMAWTCLNAQTNYRVLFHYLLVSFKPS